MSFRIDARLFQVIRLLRKLTKRSLVSAKINILEGRFIVKLGMRWMRVAYHDKPIPLSALLLLRKFARGEDVLFPELHTVRISGKALRNPFLSSRLADIELGTWSLATDTLNFLEQQIQNLKPKVVLEFGSGVSTACLVRYMQELHGDSNQVYVFSIEQDIDFTQNTEQLLEALSLKKYCKVIYSPLRERVIKGFQTTCYDLSEDFLNEVLKDTRPEFVVIDGPAAEPGARFGTLPLVQPFLSSNAWFFLDDALRDGELKAAQLWDRFLPDVRIHGIFLIGKGLLVGQIRGTFDHALPHPQHRLP